MPPAAAAAPAGAGEGQPAPNPVSNFLTALMRMGMMWYMFNMFKGGGQTPAATGSAGAGAVVKPLYARGEAVDMRVFLFERPYLHDFAKGTLVWEVPGVPLGTAKPQNHTYTYHPSEAVKNNGSLFLHAVFSRAGVNISEREELPAGSVFVKSFPLVRFMAPPKNKTGVNLLSSEGGPVTTPKSDPDAPAAEWVSFFKPNATIAIVDHFQAYSRAAVPQPLREHFQFAETGDADAEHYLPLAYFDEFWLLRDKLVPLNDTLDAVDLHLDLKTASIWWMQMQQQIQQSFSMQTTMGIASDGESDEVKRIFLEGNPYLLALTMVVSMLHSVFDFLAFKNDVAFWKDNRSMEGLSARSIMVNAFCQLVIMLYLFDNETSTVVLISSAVGTAIEFWKVTKAFDVSVTQSFPFVSVKDKASYKDGRHNTNKHDAEAMRYLSYALYPCIIGYSVYALLYDTHKSWYSWVLGSLVGAVYTFGFILMCPQLYLNYKLKSVAHLPWRQMTYKFLNTIIDDLFAFVIKMPLLHRLSVFRDDIIFLIFIYQRWIYRVDKTRVNEFGFSAEMQEERERQRLLGAGAAGAGAGEGEGAAAAIEGDGAAAGGAAQQQGGGAARRRKAAAAAAGGGEGGSGAEAVAVADGEDESRKDL